jgi:hypothetical protein
MESSGILASIIPVISAVIGLFLGLLVPVVTGKVEAGKRSHEGQRDQCDEILGLFRDVNVYVALTDSRNNLRRNLLLGAVKLRDDRARETCVQLVSLSALLGASEPDIIDAWTLMVEEVARVYRENS